MASNQLRDDAILRQLGVIRFTNGLYDQVRAVLRAGEDQIIGLTDRLPPMPSRARQRSYMRQVLRIRQRSFREAQSLIRTELAALSRTERRMTIRSFTARLFGLYTINGGDTVNLNGLVFQGFTLSQHLNNTRRQDGLRIQSAVVNAATIGLSASQRRGAVRRRLLVRIETYKPSLELQEPK